MFVSALFHAAWNLGARQAKGSLGVILLGLWFGCLALLPFVALTATAADFTAQNLLNSGLTGFLVGIYVTFLSGAYGVEELTFVYPISRGIGLVGTAAFGAILFGETFSSVGKVALGLVLAGTVVIGLDRNRKAWRKGLALAVLSGIALVGAYVLGKAIAKSMHPVSYSFCLYAAAALTMMPTVLLRRCDLLVTAWRSQKALSFGIGTSAVTSYLLVLFAFRLDPAGHLIGVREVSVVFAAIGGYLWLRETMTTKKFIGVVAILLGAFFLKGG